MFALRVSLVGGQRGNCALPQMRLGQQRGIGEHNHTSRANKSIGRLPLCSARDKKPPYTPFGCLFLPPCRAWAPSCCLPLGEDWAAYGTQSWAAAASMPHFSWAVAQFRRYITAGKCPPWVSGGPWDLKDASGAPYPHGYKKDLGGGRWGELWPEMPCLRCGCPWWTNGSKVRRVIGTGLGRVVQLTRLFSCGPGISVACE